MHEMIHGMMSMGIGFVDEELEMVWYSVKAGKSNFAGIDYAMLLKEISGARSFLRNDWSLDVPGCGRLQQPTRALTESVLFDRFVVAVIIVNCVCMAVEDPLCTAQNHNGDECRWMCSRWIVKNRSWSDHVCDESRGLFASVAESVFLLIFTVEIVLKLAANGGLYFKRGSNVLDAVIVMSGWLGLVLEGPNITILRMIRVLRPLRMVVRTKRMQVLIRTCTTVIHEIPPVLGIMLVFYIICAICGMALFMTALRNQCFFVTDAQSPSRFYRPAQVNGQPMPEVNGTNESWRMALPSECPFVNSPWCDGSPQDDGDRLCGGSRLCPIVDGVESVCRAKLPGLDKWNELPRQFGAWSPNFDSFPSAMLTIFQVTTLRV